MATVRDDVTPTLEKSALFAGMSREQVRAAAAEFDEDTYLEGHGILTEGLSGPDFFIILDGEADVSVDGMVVTTSVPATSSVRSPHWTARSAPPASAPPRGCAASRSPEARSVRSCSTTRSWR